MYNSIAMARFTLTKGTALSLVTSPFNRGAKATAVCLLLATGLFPEVRVTSGLDDLLRLKWRWDTTTVVRNVKKTLREEASLAHRGMTKAAADASAAAGAASSAVLKRGGTRQVLPLSRASTCSGLARATALRKWSKARLAVAAVNTVTKAPFEQRVAEWARSDACAKSAFLIQSVWRELRAPRTSYPFLSKDYTGERAPSMSMVNERPQGIPGQGTSGSARDPYRPLDTHERCLVLFLNSQTWSGTRGARLARQVSRVLESGARILLIHDVASCPFHHVLEATPRELVEAGLYKTLATDVLAGRAEVVSGAHFATALGAKRIKGSKRAKPKGRDHHGGRAGGATAAPQVPTAPRAHGMLGGVDARRADNPRIGAGRIQDHMCRDEIDAVLASRGHRVQGVRTRSFRPGVVYEI